MNFNIDKSKLLKGLNSVQSVAGRRTTLPILSHVLLEAEKDCLRLTGTDLETGIREEAAADVIQEGKASVSAKKLYEIVKELPDETVHIETKDNHWIVLQCGKSTFNLAGLDPEEFPSLPTFREEHFTKMPRITLMGMIEKTVFAASNEESRHHLNGILFKQAGKEVCVMVATDGHRLSLIQREGYRIRGIEKGIILPKKGVMEARKIMEDKEEGDIQIYFDETHGFFKIGRSLIILRLIDGEFPDYEQVIPKAKESDKAVRMEREKIRVCLRRISTMASDRVEGVKIAFRKDVMEGTSFNQDFGDAKEEVGVGYDGPPIEIGFNAKYLLDVFNVSVVDTDEIWLQLKDEGSPAVLRPASSPDKPPASIGPNDQLIIIMPMRI